MKGKFLIFFCSITLCLISQVRKNVFVIKPTLGFNACQIDGDSYGGYNKLGLLAGAAVNAKLKEQWNLEMGFYFSQKGAQKNANPNNGDYHSLKINLNYIDLPLSLYYTVRKKYFINGGFSIAYLINYSEYQDGSDLTSLYKFNTFDFGLNGGLGMSLNDKINFELRWLNSIVPIRSSKIYFQGAFYPNPAARFFSSGMFNNVISVFFTYKFGKNKSGTEKSK